MPNIKPIISSRRYSRKVESPNEHWEILEDGINKIFQGKVNELSFEKLYTTVYGLVLNKNGPQLQRMLSKLLSYHFGIVRDTLEQQTGLDALESLNLQWDEQKVYLRQISDVFIYMDLVYSKRENKPDVSSLGSRLFVNQVIEPVSDMLKESLIDEINKARTTFNEYSGLEIVKNAISVLAKLEMKEGMSSIFLTDFEPFLLERSEIYYKSLHERLQQSQEDNGWKDFNALLRLLNVEDEMCKRIFDDQDTILKFHKIAEKALVSDNIEEIAAYSLRNIVKNSQIKEMSTLMSLSSSLKDRIVILERLSNCITDDVNSIQVDNTIRKKSGAAVKWIQDLISLKIRYYDLVSQLSNDQALTYKYINEAFGKSINEIKVFPEFLSLYFDTLLKSPDPNLKENITVVKNCIYFFKLFKDKDTFEVIYRQQLSRRLLQQKSDISEEQELILLLQEDVGASYTSKLRGMLRDLHLSKAFIQKNKKMLPSNQLELNILTQMFWPLQKSDMNKQVNIPDSLISLKSDFEKCYTMVHSGRLLEWMYYLSTIEIAYQFRDSYHELSMQMYCGIIFLLFKDHQSLTFDEIVELTNLPVQEVRRNLISMSIAPKTRILRKSPPGKTVSNEDVFSINQEFSAPQRKVKVLMVLMNSNNGRPLTPNENSRTSIDKKLLDSRLSVVNATITRIMKQERKLHHSQLQERVSASVNLFEVNTSMFKTSLEYLINNEYIQRDFDNTTLYHYLP